MQSSRLTATAIAAACLIVLVSGCSSRNPQGGEAEGFYSYVDAQGNLVTINGPGVDNATADEKRKASSGPAVTGSSTVPGSSAKQGMATTPNELWAQSDEGYLSSDEVEQRLRQQDKERFVSYPDEQGRVMTYSVDMAAARELGKEQRQHRNNPGRDLAPHDEVGVRTSWLSVPVDCCAELLERAPVLAVNDEARVVFSVGSTVSLAEPRPGRAWKLGEGVSRIQIQSWNNNGYQWPEVLFLGADGKPLSMAADLFTQTLPETWSSEASVQGEVDVEPGSTWVVLFLGYVTPEDRRLELEQNAIKLGDDVFTLSYRADTVIRGLSAKR